MSVRTPVYLLELDDDLPVGPPAKKRNTCTHQGEEMHTCARCGMDYCPDCKPLWHAQCPKRTEA